ncbi:MAG: TlyA family RNA methyltransferase [Candidatus Riflebacteria bacterium]|nr:TlyA family RNA methyltransferase [Candidatus Riflebacteria bacterium]
MNLRKKIRIDELLLERNLAPDMKLAQAMILAGEVYCSNRTLDKPGEKISPDTPVFLKKNPCPFVSWGGMKLNAALEHFSFPLKGKNCLDIGASTGGFTDVLLKHGANQVTALDVAYGIISLKIRNDPRVKVIEKTNFREIPDNFFPEKFDLIVVDVSFISLKHIFPKAFLYLKEQGEILALIKPQFEAPKALVEPGGIVKDQEVQKNLIFELSDFGKINGIFLKNLFPLPFFHSQKNLEFFSRWQKDPPELSSQEIIEKMV